MCPNQVLPLNISGMWLAIKEAISNQKYFNALIQWDDSWLLTVLRCNFFEKYYHDTGDIRYQMEELLSNKKHYRSMIKKMDSFLELDRIITANFTEEKLKKIEMIVGSAWGLFLDKIKNHIREYKKTDLGNKIPYKGFFLNELRVLFSTIGLENDFYKLIEACIYELTIDKFNAKDCFVVFNTKVKTGLEKHPPFLYQGDQIIKFNQVSKIEHELKFNQQTFPLFYIYIREGERIIHEEYIKMVGEKISHGIIKFINSLVKPTKKEDAF